MKKTGLSNRFSAETRNVWLDWYECLICGFNQPDALHHIVSPSSKHYVAGKHNESVYNSCPIHNQLHPNSWQMQKDGVKGFGATKPCHVGNEAYLYDEINIMFILGKVKRALKELEYVADENDREFLKVYAHLYNKSYPQSCKLDSSGSIE